MILGIGKNKIYCYKIIDKNVYTNIFKEFLKELVSILNKTKDKKFILKLDNLRVHKTDEVFKFLKENNICVSFNASYMSIFNSIELAFRSVKKKIYSN